MKHALHNCNLGTQYLRAGVVQIRKTGQGGTHPPVVYQPLRSPKSPYASNYRPGASCTLPAKMGPHRMTADLCGFPFELNVQIRPCSDEKILRKNLSQDNLLRADYISRPNEKCTFIVVRKFIEIVKDIHETSS